MERKIITSTFIAGFAVYNIVALILFGCRSADVGAIAIVILVIAEKKLLRIRKETLIAGVLVMCIATLLPVYLVVNHSQKYRDIVLY